MTELIVKTQVCDAHFPRMNRESTIGSDDRLKLVFNTYSTSQYPSLNQPDKINLLFFHGATLSKEVWNYYIEKFYADYGSQLGTVITFDAVGHAASYLLNKGKLGWVYSWEDGGKDAIAILKFLNLKGKTILIGHSMGGTSAIHATQLEKNLIDSAITIEPVCYTDVEAFKANRKLRDNYYKLFFVVKKSIQTEFKSLDEYNKFMTKRNHTRTFHPRILKDLLDHNTVKHPDGSVSYITPPQHQLTAYASSLLSTIYIPDLAKTIDCEVLHIIGADATWNPPEAASVLRASLKYGTSYDIPKGQHAVPYEQPDETYNAMRAFFEKRVKRVREIAAQYPEPKSDEERENFYWNGAEQVRELYSSDKQWFYHRL